MPDLLAWTVALAPALSVLVLVGRRLAAIEDDEDTVLRLAVAGLGIGVAAATASLAMSAVEGPFTADLGRWLPEVLLHAPRRLEVTPLGAAWALTCLSLSLGVLWFSRTYLHREPGFLRAVALSTLFGGATALVGLADDAVTLLLAWELAGTSSVLLIAWFAARPRAVTAGWRALVAGRVADLALLGVIVVLGLRHGSTAFEASHGSDLLLAALLALAAAVKSAQLPFSSWLGRAAEGPTTTSALFYGGLMTHVGLVLLWRTWPLLEGAWAVRSVLAASGLATLAWSGLGAMAQGDVKRHLLLSSLAGVSALVVVSAAGAPGVALGLALPHLVLRTVQILLSPSWIAVRPRVPASPAPPWLVARPALQTVARLGAGLEPATDRLARGLVDLPSGALAWLERRVVQPFSLGALPAVERMAAMVATEERHLEPFHVDPAEDSPGLVASSLGRLAQAVHRAEDALVADLVGRSLPRTGVAAGLRLARVEAFLARPLVQAVLLLVVGLALSGGLS